METREYFVQMDTLMPIAWERMAEGQAICFSPYATNMLSKLCTTARNLYTCKHYSRFLRRFWRRGKGWIRRHLP